MKNKMRHMMNQRTYKILLKALKVAYEHLEYCGYGDEWERECARAAKLPELIESAITKAEAQ